MLQRMNSYWMGSISVVVLTNFDESIGKLHLKLQDTLKNKEAPHELQKQVPTSHFLSFCITFKLKFYNFADFAILQNNLQNGTKCWSVKYKTAYKM